MPRSRRGNSVSSSGTNPTETTPAHPSTSPTQIPPQTFPLALPPPKSTGNKHIRLSSRLLLQIQQLQTSSRSRTTRAIPILELYQPPTFGKTISIPGHHGSGNTCRKVHGKDLYLTQSEEFAHLRRGKRVGFVDGDGLTNGMKPRSGSGGSGYASTASPDGGSYVSGSGTGSGPSSGDETERKTKSRSKQSRKSKNPTTTPNNQTEEGREEIEDDTVSIIHTSPKPRSKDSMAPDAELFFPLSGLAFDASVKGSGVYSFESSNWHTKICFTWEKRPPSRAGEKAEGDRFVLSFSGSSSETTSLTPERKGWLAQLTKRGISVCGLEGDALAGAGGDSTWAALDGEGVRGGQGAGLYTLILSSALWVARGEGWV
ncbi:hypothetical protein BDV19DRAFT_360261 [Aspergillus venezuelensis]